MQRQSLCAIAFWLRGVKDNIVKWAAKILMTVLSVLQKPEHRRAAKDRIKETAKPAVSELLMHMNTSCPVTRVSSVNETTKPDNAFI